MSSTRERTVRGAFHSGIRFALLPLIDSAGSLGRQRYQSVAGAQSGCPNETHREPSAPWWKNSSRRSTSVWFAACDNRHRLFAARPSDRECCYRRGSNARHLSGLYTPMKPLSIWNTVVGAFPGALPPVIGWCAARGTISLEAICLFLILFIWQLPHFFAIAWLYRDDYAAGGFRMLPIIDRDGTLTGRAMIGTCVLLLIVTVLPAMVGMAGPLFLACASILGVCFLNCAIQFRKSPTRVNAKHVLRASLLYLTGLMLLLLCDGACYGI